MTLGGLVGEEFPWRSTNRRADTQGFLATHPVFSLREAAEALRPRGGSHATIERLKHYLEKGRLKLVTRGVYAVVPAGVRADGFQPDPFLVASTVRPDGVFSHHSALELLGAAHATWSRCTLWVSRRRSELKLNGVGVRFLQHPKPLRRAGREQFATRRVEHRGRLLTTTGPERTLVEGFRNPALTGGVDELVESAAGFPVLDLDLLERVLDLYGVRRLWAAVGWLLETYRQTFHVSEEVLGRLESSRPTAPQYLLRGTRGGRLSRRWNLVLPDVLTSREPDERQR